jgi:translocation and assembly module TamA
VANKQPKNEISPVKRFYGGGPGSVRAYGYQKIGPIDTNGIPIGGKSLAEWSGELRFRINESFGAVAFLDAGSVLNAAAPGFSKNSLLYGPGVGLRYFSTIGPVRLDIAFPLKRRKNQSAKFIDAPFQIYISIGQAF